MKRSLYITLATILITPLMAYSAIQVIEPSDPDIVIVKKPNMFSAEWKKVSYSDEFTDYIDTEKIERNFDSTIEIVSMRNFFKRQKLDSSIDASHYKSIVYYETVDCFHQTITVNKMFLLADHFANGSLVEEPSENFTNPINVKPGSVGYSMITKVCGLAYEGYDSKYIKSSFMNNI